MGRRSDRKRYENPELVVRRANTLDVQVFAPLLRKADELEVDAAAQQTPEEALTDGLKYSDPCYAAFWKGEPLCMFGVVPHNMPEDPERFGAIWLLGTDLIDEMGLGFLRASQQWIEDFSEIYVALGNRVDCRNEAHIKWLNWLGFTLLQPEEFGPYKLLFQEFYKINTAKQKV